MIDTPNLAERESELQLVLDILSDMIFKYLEKQASPELRAATLAIMEEEQQEQLDWEMTCELLGTTEFRIRAVA
ncbi:hypothetical protein [Cohnella fermenti]|uniref:Uncharacterized protein n=1 Tax=Cohnella fermenti TaxID=2565925 RepID=A0A4S4BI22_9BACL|nr:hypothetical protein [Cohnella fermenti]THF74124.1 hypothetical protein E6C55_26205 [Cohnella fermenti]